jgi:hypothetical protein
MHKRRKAHWCLMSEEARPMSKPITSFVGLDVHMDSNAIGVAEAGREARDSSAP